MEKGLDTGFKDKSGKNIHVGDTIQHRLGKFGKAGGPINKRVIKSGKKYYLVLESDHNNKYGGIELSDRICQKSVIIDCRHSFS